MEPWTRLEIGLVGKQPGSVSGSDDGGIPTDFIGNFESEWVLGRIQFQRLMKSAECADECDRSSWRLF